VGPEEPRNRLRVARRSPEAPPFREGLITSLKLLPSKRLRPKYLSALNLDQHQTPSTGPGREDEWIFQTMIETGLRSSQEWTSACHAEDRGFKSL
jgi:hypothetical protein